jgi:hypothetical protein
MFSMISRFVIPPKQGEDNQKIFVAMVPAFTFATGMAIVTVMAQISQTGRLATRS